jgi:hypothetical protein
LTKLLNASSTNDTFDILNQLLHKTKAQPLPLMDSIQDLANAFVDFFTDKIARVRSSLQQSTDPLDPPSSTPAYTNIQRLMASFHPTSPDTIRNILGSMNPE